MLETDLIKFSVTNMLKLSPKLGVTNAAVPREFAQNCEIVIKTYIMNNHWLKVCVLEFFSLNMALELNMLSERMSKSRKLKDVLTTFNKK